MRFFGFVAWRSDSQRFSSSIGRVDDYPVIRVRAIDPSDDQCLHIEVVPLSRLRRRQRDLLLPNQEAVLRDP